MYDPHRVELTGYRREGGGLREIPEMNGWVSPLLGIRFEMGVQGLTLYRPNGTRSMTFVELERCAEQEKQRAHSAEARYQALCEMLRTKGLSLDPPR